MELLGINPGLPFTAYYWPKRRHNRQPVISLSASRHGDRPCFAVWPVVWFLTWSGFCGGKEMRHLCKHTKWVTSREMGGRTNCLGVSGIKSLWLELSWDSTEEQLHSYIINKPLSFLSFCIIAEGDLDPAVWRVSCFPRHTSETCARTCSLAECAWPASKCFQVQTSSFEGSCTTVEFQFSEELVFPK